MIDRRTVAGAALAGGVALNATQSANAQAAFRARNIVLVHGAFADGSSWSEVIARLQPAGLRVTAVQNPLTSLADDVAATRRALAQQDGPTVLVGHSWGGTVISEAGVDPKVAALVYVAALAPEAGEDFGALAKRFPAAPGQAGIRAAGGFAQLTEEAFVNDFAPDVDPARARVMFAAQGPIDAALFGSKTTQAAWRDKPCWYAVSRRDRIVPPEMQRFFAQRMKATTRELDASHVSLVSRPAEVADLVTAAARGARV